MSRWDKRNKNTSQRDVPEERRLQEEKERSGSIEGREIDKPDETTSWQKNNFPWPALSKNAAMNSLWKQELSPSDKQVRYGRLLYLLTRDWLYFLHFATWLPFIAIVFPVTQQQPRHVVLSEQLDCLQKPTLWHYSFWQVAHRGLVFYIFFLI